MNTLLLSPFMAQVIEKFPNFDIQSNKLFNFSVEEFRDSLNNQNLNELKKDESIFYQELRNYRQKLFAQIAYAVVSGKIDILQSGKILSRFADACLLQCLEYYDRQLRQKHGEPLSNNGEYSPLCIINMGKLGGNELNFSSDIDIIFAYHFDGQTQANEQQKKISVQEFYQKLIKKIMLTLSKITPDGFVFRVDTRLRPFGKNGALVFSLEYLKNYLQDHSRDWERLAYSKARIIALNEKIIKAFYQEIYTYVYRQYTDFGLLESIREMRDNIANHTLSKQQKNIKIGYGGIRVLEFCLQSIQFTLVKKNPQLQGGGSFWLLQQLKKNNLLESQDVQIFRESLEYLRSIEDRLQYWDNQQIHTLPSEDQQEQWQWLCKTMQVSSQDKLQQKINQVRQQVDQQFAKILAQTPVENVLSLSGVSEFDEQQIEQWLKAKISLSHKNIHQSNLGQCLLNFIQSNNWSAASDHSQHRFCKMLAKLFKIITEKTEKENFYTQQQNWQLFFNFISCTIRRSAYLSLLTEYPSVLNRLLDWSFNEPWLFEQILEYPSVLETMIDPTLWQAEIKRKFLKNQWNNIFKNLQNNYLKDNFEKKINSLREFNRSAIFKVASLNQTQQLDTYKISDYLTSIARHTVQAAYQITLAEMQKEWQEKIEMTWQEVPFLVVGYGKLGSFELGFGSDLDLIFIFDDTKSESKQLKFYIQLARKLITSLSSTTIAGSCYEIDCRLRPDGNKGLLVTGINQFREYYQNRAWLWEKQALIKARTIAGNKPLAKQFLIHRKHILSQAIQGKDEQQLKNKFQEMRQKMLLNKDQTNADSFDIKQGRGGMVDIEFLSQYHTLKLIPQHPSLLNRHSVSALLRKIQQLKETDLPSEKLIQTYITLRNKSHQLNLQKKPALINPKDQPKYLQEVVKLWNDTFSNQ